MNGLVALQHGAYGTLKGGIVVIVLWVGFCAGIAVVGELAFGGGIEAIATRLF